MGWLLSCALLLTVFVFMGKIPVAPSSNTTPVQEVLGLPSPQSGHGQPQAGITQPSTPVPQMINPKGGVVRRNLRGWREWRRADPTLINSLWRSKMGNGIRKQLGNAEVYIMLALLIGLVTVVIGCWLSDNCWSPEPEGMTMTVA